MKHILTLLIPLLLTPLAALQAAAAKFAKRPNILYLFTDHRVYRGQRRRLFQGDGSVLSTFGRVLVVSLVAAAFGAATTFGSDSGKSPESAAVNLATTRCGAFLLASSFRDVTTRYPDNLVDNDATTSWQAWDDSFSQWIEVRWPHPVRVSAVHLDAVSPSRITAVSVHGWRGGKWQVLAGAKGENAVSSVRFEESEVDRLRIDLLAGDGGPATLAAVRVTGPDQPILRAIEPYWNAWYVWFPEPDRAHKTHAPRYFRKVFDVPDPSLIKSAFVQARSNDAYTLYVNGREIVSGSKDTRLVAVRDALRPGKNVIAVVADLASIPSRYGWGAVLAELALNYETENVYVGTDETWRASDTLRDGWQGMDFDDSAWSFAKAYDRPPCEPWGRIPYSATSWRETAILSSCRFGPDEARPGGRVEVAFEVTPRRRLRNDYVFVVELTGHRGSGDGASESPGNFSLTTKCATPTGLH